MTLSLTGHVPTPVAAYHFGDGYSLTVGSVTIVLTEKEADQLGRYLLFDTPEKESE